MRQHSEEALSQNRQAFESMQIGPDNYVRSGQSMNEIQALEQRLRSLHQQESGRLEGYNLFINLCNVFMAVAGAVASILPFVALAAPACSLM